MCEKGHELVGGQECVVCNGTSYGEDGLTCKGIVGCVEGDEGQWNATCRRCEEGQGLVNGTCEECAVGQTYSDGTIGCTDVCPAFSDSEEVCRKSGMCVWNEKYRVCYREEQSKFTEIVVEEGKNVSEIVEVLEENKGVIVVYDEERRVVMVYGEMEAEEAQRVMELGGVVTEDVDVGQAVDGEELSEEQGFSRGGFIGGVVAGGAVILGLAAAIVTMLLNTKSQSPILL